MARVKRADAMKERASLLADAGSCMRPSPPGWVALMTEDCDGREVVGMDLHRRRSVLVRMTPDGRKLETARISKEYLQKQGYAFLQPAAR